MSEGRPCEAGCILGHGDRCYAATTRHWRFCQLIAAGRDDYRRLVDGLSRGEVMPPQDDEARRRRASKPRIPLGVKQEPG